MNCSVLRCENSAVDGSSFCAMHQPSGLILPMKRTEDQNQEEAKKIREDVAKSLEAVAECMNRAKALGFTVAFDVQQEPGTGRYHVRSLMIARYY